ncbi:MAG: class I SAM-dependent methyltransferase [Promethearchaeota archaeon]
MIDNKELFQFLVSEAEHPFLGWNFSYIGNRVKNAPLSWCYHSEILPLIRKVNSLLDIGTGGGEFLSILMPLPKYTCATEGYKPNFPIAKELLEPLGVKVFLTENNEDLPFNDEEFEIVIDRHESYSSREIHRILKPGGLFITQQVGDQNDSKLRFILTNKAKLDNHIDWNLNVAIKELEANGFKILNAKEDITLTRIFDVGAIVCYFKAVPWELPDFSVKKYSNKLNEVHNHIIKNGYLDLENNNHRFFIKAKKQNRN